jgi:4-amino-4-deoxy-L-arabinose transferase-like glycosyltransferase
MAGAFKVFGIFSQQAAIAIESFLAVVSSLTCLLVYSLGRRLYNAQVGLLAALILAVYPPSVFYAVLSLWDTSLFTCCLLLTILLFLKLGEHPSVKKGVYIGIVMGFTALVNPIIVAAYPFAFAWVYVKADGTPRLIIKTLASMLIAFGITISPWLVRNYIVFGQFTFIKSNFGNELFLGAQPRPASVRQGADNDPPDKLRLLTEDEKRFLRESDEPTRNGYLLRRALGLIAEDPLHFTRQVMGRFIRYWTIMRPQRGVEAKLSLMIYLVTLTLAISGLILGTIRGRNIQLLLIFLLFVPAPYYLTVVHIFRYRYPLEPILIIFASYTIYRLAIHFWSKVKVNEFREKAA